VKKQEIRSLGLILNVSVPSSVQEFDQLGKREGACLDEATNNVLYRSVLAEFRDTFCEKIEADTKIERKTRETTKKDKDGNPVVVFDETEGDYMKRVCAQLSRTPESFQSVADAVVAAIVFDPSATERKAAGPKKLPKLYLDIAQSVIDQGAAEKVAAKLSGIVGTTVSPTLEGLANAIRAKQELEKKALVANLVS
jgi:hypothetical protein